MDNRYLTPGGMTELFWAMLGAGVPEQVSVDNARAFSLIGEGDAAWLTDDSALVLGRAPRSFRDFASGHRAAFA